MSAKRFTGRIVSDKMQGTVVVTVEMHKKHSIYLKIVKNTRRFKAQNGIGAKHGDLVLIQECKPIAKKVTWKVVEKVEEK
jgi:small subunit ribosomal protein S17